MRFSLVAFLFAAVVLIASGCRTTRNEDSPARPKRSMSAFDVASLPFPISLAELERRFGPAEGEPGPCVTYRVKNQKNQIFWVGIFRPQTGQTPPAEQIVVHHIVTGSPSEEKGPVVWPPFMVGKTSAQAGGELAELYEHSAMDVKKGGNGIVFPAATPARAIH